MILTNSLAQKLSRDFGFYGFAAEQNGFTLKPLSIAIFKLPEHT